MNKEEFVKELEKLGIEVTEEKLEKLNKFYNLLIEWNEKINLTTITGENDVYLKHFYDSLTLVKEIDFNKDIYICDVGSGAGFPGIVLKIFFPNIKVKLIDSLQKRVNYLNAIIEELELQNIDAEHFRMEEYSILNEEKFDYITARAVANLSLLTEISIKALKINGHMVFMKANCDEELTELLKREQKLNFKVENINKFKLPIEESNRTLVNLVKTNHTDKKYPRRIEIIRKEIE